MNVQQFVKECKSRRTTLRSAIPGRGKYPTSLRKSIKQTFAQSDNIVDGVKYDPRTGLSSQEVRQLSLMRISVDIEASKSINLQVQVPRCPCYNQQLGRTQTAHGPRWVCGCNKE